ncbi:hypothetical protein PHYBOEH_006451 [Phytophthora boehmeriae]|uniref:CCT domain-containing protein n=1 Tax=Phytophthora boehmeriae TaxID=109152 RepID=A0A8T1WEP4_9STRA|nr:hypothetical protein PHYBOEH_006451 [Phytophthora boehmeriae]
MLLARKRSRDQNVTEPTLPVLRRPGDNRWLLGNSSRSLETVKSEPMEERPLQPFARARLSSQELFLSVVMEWQRTEPTSAEAHSDAVSDGYVTPSSEDLDAEYQSQRKTVDEVSPTSVHNPPRELTPLRLDYITEPVKMIGVYSPAARRVLLQKYMAKRARRLSQHKVRYGVRKTLANARPRVKGRFVKTVQPLTAAAVEAQRTDPTL